MSEELSDDVADDLCQNPGHADHRFALGRECMEWTDQALSVMPEDEAVERGLYVPPTVPPTAQHPEAQEWEARYRQAVEVIGTTSRQLGEACAVAFRALHDLRALGVDILTLPGVDQQWVAALDRWEERNQAEESRCQNCLEPGHPGHHWLRDPGCYICYPHPGLTEDAPPPPGY